MASTICAATRFWVQRGHRVLEDHADARAAHGADAGRRQFRQVLAAKADRAGDDAARLVDQPQDGQAGHALAGARFTDDAENLAGPYLQAEVIDGAHDAVGREEIGAQAGHLEQRRGIVARRSGCDGGRRRRADRAARHSTFWMWVEMTTVSPR
jgi:hypothetical protein